MRKLKVVSLSVLSIGLLFGSGTALAANVQGKNLKTVKYNQQDYTPLTEVVKNFGGKTRYDKANDRTVWDVAGKSIPVYPTNVKGKWSVPVKWVNNVVTTNKIKNSYNTQSYNNNSFNQTTNNTTNNTNSNNTTIYNGVSPSETKNLPTVSEKQILKDAYENDNWDAVKNNIKKINLNAKLDDGRTLLHIATYRNFTDIVELLCDNGANVNAQDDEGLTPLHYAAELSWRPALYEDTKTMDVLLHAGANPNLKSKDGETPFDKSAAGSAFYYGISPHTKGAKIDMDDAIITRQVIESKK